MEQNQQYQPMLEEEPDIVDGNDVNMQDQDSSGDSSSDLERARESNPLQQNPPLRPVQRALMQDFAEEDSDLDQSDDDDDASGPDDEDIAPDSASDGDAMAGTGTDEDGSEADEATNGGENDERQPSTAMRDQFEQYTDHCYDHTKQLEKHQVCMIKIMHTLGKKKASLDTYPAVME